MTGTALAVAGILLSKSRGGGLTLVVICWQGDQGVGLIFGSALVGALLAGGGVLTGILGFLAIVFATLNVVGGFLVTHRMLGMFRSKARK